jgi:hypothetical protein
MSDTSSDNLKAKSFWSRPEGKTGIIFLLGIGFATGLGILSILPILGELLRNAVTASVLISTIAALIYVLIDNRSRNLIWYIYKSAMRKITSWFIQIDPIAILRGYVDHLKKNLFELKRQINKLRGQMQKLKEIIVNNQKEIKANLELASEARDNNVENVMILKTRKAGRLKESNMRLEDLYNKMEILYRVLSKMRENSSILMEDIEDQVMVKEQEQKAIHASNTAMRSAMSILSGDPDKRALFDAAMEAITEDVASKVGEMEDFMQMSSKFMESIDLQNGIFEEEGLRMLEEWEQNGVSKILGKDKETLLLQAHDQDNVLDLNTPIKEPIREAGHRNQYDSFFDFD